MTTTISNSILSAKINHQGAELISLQSIETKREYIWEGNPEFWGKHAPILFPIVGTLKNNTYQYLDKMFSLNRHGFARDFEFQLIQKETDKVVFSLQDNGLTFNIFPFHFELQLIYTLKKSELIVTYKVINKDQKTIPFSIGGHPAFALKNKFENYSLLFEAGEKLICYQLEEDLLSETTQNIELKNNQLPLTYSLFEKDALVFKCLKSKHIKILENNLPILNFKFKDFPNFGIWTKTNAPFICLEPWLGYADTTHANGNILEKEGIQFVESNFCKEYSFSLEII
ncbi:aldose 1-epimerase family protein [Flavobacterium sp. J49]|uniref:aldose 1-epimerase family protein n=1 Tax=Flavobacterium sp. J49 TaxID=2718534 RepID=UPI001594D89A|nr:aldose 1-epimerase family protein [Flavobacterium sp. J49]MBF6640758.1 aldose 1-epimerase family protein [Flavobacterium sp. J49]NIC02005.1 aldose 1-epimerase family protein [Flavobacterium sp. J49]